MLFSYLDLSQWLEYSCVGVILFCWLSEIVAAFRYGSYGLGILSLLLTPIGGFIIGWINASRWRVTQLMVMFAIATIILLALQIRAMYDAAMAIA